MRFARVILPVIGALVLVAPAVQAAQTDDKAVVQAVRATLAKRDPDIAQVVEIDAKGGVVTLTGYAATPSDVFKALADTRGVPGVVKVVNHLSLTR